MKQYYLQLYIYIYIYIYIHEKGDACCMSISYKRDNTFSSILTAAIVLSF